VRALFALGYPATFLAEDGLLDGGGKPRLFVQGENDRFGSGDTLRSLVEPYPQGRTVVVVPGTNHFFDGRLDELQGAVCCWAEERPWEGSGRGGQQ
jgi:alpha/beta superfamily hydrolase